VYAVAERLRPDQLQTLRTARAGEEPLREASRRYRVILLPIGADEARAAVDGRLEAAGYWQTGGSCRFPVRRPALIVLAGAAGLLLAAAGTALGVELARSLERAVLESVSTAPSAATEKPVMATEAVETVVPIVPKATTTAAAKPKPAKKKASEPKPVAKANVKTKPTTTAAVSPPTTKATATEPTPKLTHVPKPKPAPKPKPKPKPAPKPKKAAPALPPATVTAAPDTTAPTVTITSAPGATSQSSAAEVAFQASEADVAFACKLDAGAYAACTSPAHLNGLASGAHTFSIRGTDKAGNVGQPASVSWTYVPPDTTPPTVAITGGPSGSTAETSASFTFSADEAGSTFQCSLDGGAFSDCGSPAVYNGLAPGSHSFAVRATDKAGNTSQPDTRSWTVAAPLPDLVVSAFSRFSITVSNRGNGLAGASVLTIAYVGTFSVPSLPPGGSATFSWSTCRIVTYVAVVDRTQAVRESDESNNTASLKNACR
jgi:hypothetical protein